MPKDRTLAVRADADRSMGAGHVMRCLALAQEWAGQGGGVLFCGALESQGLRDRLADQGFESVDPGPEPEQTVDMLAGRGLGGCWVALDGYHFGPRWQDVLQDAGHTVLCVDDGALLERYSARVVLAPDHDARPSAYNAPPATLVLAGSRYRLLRRGFAGSTRPERGPAEGAVVLVAFGGADSVNATRRAVLGLGPALGPGDTLLAVLGPVNPHAESVAQALDGLACRTQLLRDVADMAGLYARCHLAVSAAGGAAWEMAAAGLPAVLVPVAANQDPGATFLAESGAAVRFGESDCLDGPDLGPLVRGLLDDAGRLAAMSQAGPPACDGQGPHRVCQVLDALSRPGVEADFDLRRAELGDAEQLFRMANDPRVRAASFSPEPIGLDAHLDWFAARLASPDTAFFVLDLAGAVAALARYDRAGDVAVIDVAAHAAFQGRGLGVRILQDSRKVACEALGVTRLRAEVLEDNAASRRCFARAGFTLAGPDIVRGSACMVYHWEMPS